MPRLELVRMMPDLEKQAREDVENAVEEPEFDYIAYAQCRIAGFRRSSNNLVRD
ncbi:hypothetical protein B0H14DRAFT_3444461 [Mycena olivaceomarginata]|nr:hypothetical protein B0H14DRAFT_3444461 [Mycena olivaceomarginata]